MFDEATYRHCIEIGYDEATAEQAAMEAGYWYAFGELPPWAWVIESVEVYDQGKLWIHSDPDKRQ